MDDWNNMYFLKDVMENNVTAALLFERFYGAHTPAISRILFCIEYITFSGSTYFPKVIAFVSIAGSIGIFYKNIQKLNVGEKAQFLLMLTGLLLAFGAAQLYTFSYPWACLQHPATILFCLMAIHLFTSDLQKNRQISITRSFMYLFLCATGSLFTAVGLFGMIIILFGMMLYRAPVMSTAAYSCGLFILMYFLMPGDIIMRASESTEITLQANQEVILEKFGVPDVHFFPGYSNYLLGFTGAMLERTSQTAAIIFGGVIFITFSLAGFLGLFRPQKQHASSSLCVC